MEDSEDTTEAAQDTVSGDILRVKKVDDDSCEKVDSGMDEEMSTQPSPDTADLNSDSEDEPVISRKKVKKAMILDDDDDDVDSGDVNDDNEKDNSESEKKENNTSEQGNASKKKTISEALSAIMDSDSESDADKAQESAAKSDKDGSSSGDESDSLTDIIRKKKAKKKALNSDEDEDSLGAPQKKSQTGLFNSDLYDAEESDSDNDAKDQQSDDEQANSDDDHNADDEGFGDDEIDPKLKAKLLKMKGAAKQPRKGKDRKAKPKGDSLMEIHSESQRLTRESRVVLPYHQPTPKPLNDFLARATKKQQDYKALRAVREFKKASVIQQVIANCSPDITLSSQQKKLSPCDKNKPHLVGGDTPSTHHTPTSNPQCVEMSQSDKLSKKMDFEDDELPDLDDTVTSADKGDNVVNDTHASVADVTEKVENIVQTDQENKEIESASQEECMEVDTAALQHNTEAVQDSESVHRESDNIDVSVTVENGINNTKIDSEEVSPKSLENSEKEETVTEDKNTTLLSECPSSASKTPQIKILSELKDLTPKLSGGGADDFIDFDENEKPLPSEREKLMNRLLEHSKKKQAKHHKDVDISIVEKESGPGNSAELKLTSITYHATEEDEDHLQKLDKPGAKLLALKEQLQSKMKVKREEARQKRQELYALENEEGFEEENEEEKILDDDAEMSDKSDTDIDDDQFDAEFGEEELEDEDEDEKEVNPFVDGEAEQDDDDYNPGEALNKESDDDDDDLESEEDGATMKLKLETSDEDESDLENLSQNVRSSSKKKRKHVRKLAISDDEESNLPPAQTTTEEPGTANFKIPKETVSPKESLEDEDDFMSPLSKHLAPTQTQKLKKGGITLPIEDSQDLYGDISEPYSGMPYPAGDTQPSQGLNFIVEDSQSQMLDADGFFKVKSITKKPSRQSLGLDDINNTQDNMNELMGLCSGRFVEPSQDDGKRTSCKQLFSDAADSGMKSTTQDQVSDELLGLCSGFFPKEGTQKPKSQGVKRKLEDDENSNNSFTLLSDNDNHMDSDKDELGEDNEEEENNDFDEVDGDASRDSSAQEKKNFRGFRGKITGKMRREFVDEEAELSGSEMGSDEDLDLAEEDDIMEMELGDQDIALTEEELRNQVGRAHLKETIDSDKREILRLQEMYLPDGDLYSETGGRMRRFKWKNIDDESQQDMFGGEGSDDEAPEEDADELRWRMERFEREKFLQEEREKEEKESGNSQFFSLGKKFALKIKDSITKSTEKEFKKPQKPEKKEQPSPVKPMLRSASGRKGSFLTRSKEALAKIAERTRSSVNPNATRNSRNFVFQHVSPEKSDTTAKPKPVSKPAAHKKSTSVQPPAKRQRTKTEERKPGSSIFNILER